MVDEKGVKAFAREVSMLATVDHVNIVSFVGFVKAPFLLIVMEFVAGGTLQDYIKAHREEMGKLGTGFKIGASLGCAAALEYLHTFEPAPVLHRDIKSENIL